MSAHIKRLENGVRVVKDSSATRGANNVASSEQNCATLRDEELRRRWLELRRAYRAFEKFINEAYALDA